MSPIIYSKDADKDRDFLKEVLNFPHVDVGGGWLIFGLPPAKIAVHPHSKNDVHEFYLMCDDVEALVADMGKRGIATTPVQNQGWGMLTQVMLPGGGKLGIYQPRHASPPQMGAKKAAPKKAAAKKPATKAAPKKAVGKKKPARKAAPKKAAAKNKTRARR